MRVQLALLSAFLLVTALLSGVNAKCAADASLEVTHEANLNGVVYIEKLIINSQWNFSFTEVRCLIKQIQTECHCKSVIGKTVDALLVSLI